MELAEGSQKACGLLARYPVMARLVNFTAGMGLLAVFLTAACATSAPVDRVEAAENRARLAAISRLPACTEAETVTGGQTAHIPSCRLKAGPSGLNLVVTSDPIEHEMLGPSGFVSISVLNRQGRLIGEFAEVTHGRYAYPALKDANGDGRQDIIIPRVTSGEATVYSLWLQQEDGDFTHAGEITGNQISWSAGGLIAAARQTGMSDWSVGYFRADAGQLQEVALVRGEGTTPPRPGGRCEIVRISEGVEPGRFCSAG